MKKLVNKRNTIIGISVITIVILIVVAVGCSAKKEDFNVSGKTNPEITDGIVINSIEDIKSLVTDDNKLVINYFDAYTWVVLCDDQSITEEMVYIYEFDDNNVAEYMLSVRKSELEKNRAMKINSCKVIDQFVVVQLTDSSFHNVTRNMLEINFDGLIVY